MIVYYGDHSITFDGEVNTWTDWHLVPRPIPIFKPPSVKTKYQEIPGMDGILDFTEVLTKRPMYNNREGSFEFIVAPGYKSWSTIYSEIMSYLHGKVRKAVLDDDRYYYYEGRFVVNDFLSEEMNSKIVIDYSVYPYKRENQDSSEPWLWDPFSFETGVIKEGSYTVSGSLKVTLPGKSDEIVIPSFSAISGSNLKVVYNGKSNSLSKTSTKFSDIKIGPEPIQIEFTGNGTVGISYRRGKL